MNRKKLLLPVILLLVGVAGFAALKASRPKQSPVPPQEQVWRIETVAVEPRRQSPVLKLYGKVESPELTRAAAPGVGRVTRVSVREGQPVRAGQLLVELDPRDFQPRVDQARGEVEELMAAIRSEELRHAADLEQLEQERRLLEFATADVDRYEQLRQENFYSQAAVDQSRQNLARQRITLRSRELAIADHQARLTQLRARLTRATAGLEQAELALQRSRVVAPFDGYAADLEVAEGDQVNSGQTLLTLYPYAGLEVRAKIPAPYQDEIIARIGTGQSLDARATLGGAELRMRLARVAGAADTRGLDGFFQLRDAGGQLRVGSLLTLHLTRAPLDDAIAIPYAALYGGGQVYKVQDGRIRAVAVAVAGELPGEPPALLIRSAELAPGDRVMATHLPNAVSGLKVEVLR
ncbi:MAG: biotin/lipoyl-binding protein [Thiobacillaceae bacterium]|jgi:multidrug efflux pump subunit AcrA (membrane-fusion protein)|nr:biotin/lipoyl-binding protein [Thiobacillaceae bacterium]